MDKILGIVSEYNPFHLGHLYHLQKSKEIVNPDYTVAVMSGNFVERGDTAIVDKWSRAEMALNNEIDLVIELPLVYSISSAENFAMGSIKILDSLNMDTTVSFGSECGQISILNEIAQVLVKEPPEYLSILNHELSLGVSFPKAREHALLMYLNDIRKYANILSESNNILGIEYLKAIQKQKAKLSAVTIKRKGAKYNSTSLDGSYPSATAIRQGIINGENLEKYMPNTSYKILQDKITKNEFVPGIATFEQAILYRLRTMSTQEIRYAS
ncbi:MAG: nucleotidyltransferase family protein [Clostridia bacterium]